MKIVCHINQGLPELCEACQAISNVTLKIAKTVSNLKRAIVDAEMFIVNGGMYTTEVAKTIKQYGNDLRWIQFSSSGIDSPMLHGAPDGVTLTNAGDVWAPTVAEHATALLLGLARQVHRLERTRIAGDGSREVLSPLMFSVRGSTIVIVGLGAIGRETAARVKALGARIIGVVRNKRDFIDIDQVVAIDQLAQMLSKADAVILALPLTTETRHIINADMLARMKPSAVIVNISRGDIIDEEALVEALRVKKISGAGLDVFSTEPLPANNPLRDLDNVILSPHVAGFGDSATIQELVRMICDNIERYLSGRKLRNLFTLTNTGLR